MSTCITVTHHFAHDECFLLLDGNKSRFIERVGVRASCCRFCLEEIQEEIQKKIQEEGWRVIYSYSFNCSHSEHVLRSGERLFGFVSSADVAFSRVIKITCLLLCTGWKLLCLADLSPRDYSAFTEPRSWHRDTEFLQCKTRYWDLEPESLPLSPPHRVRFIVGSIVLQFRLRTLCKQMQRNPCALLQYARYTHVF